MISDISAITEIPNLTQYVTDSAISIGSSFKAYRYGKIISVSIDAIISNTSLHYIFIPKNVLPPPIVQMAMGTIEYANDSTTSEHGIVYSNSDNTVIRLRVHTSNGRVLASATYIANIT